MTIQSFQELLKAQPLIGELADALGLELDNEYYVSHNRYETATKLAKKYFAKGSRDRQSVLADLHLEFPKVGAAEAVITYWIRSKIIKEISNGLYERVRSETEISNLKGLFETIFVRTGLLSKNEFITILVHLGFEGKHELEYAIRNKIVSTGFAVFGTNRQERKEIVFLGTCPF
jgi:hypothetical protein